MDTLRQDLKSGFRILTRSPGSAAVAILVLALGIGLSTAMFSIVHGVMYRPLPFEDGHRLYHLEKAHAHGWRFVSPRDYFEWSRQQTSFENLSAFAMTNVYVSDGESAERQNGAAMSASTFAALRVEPHLGRVFSADDDLPGAEPVVLLGHRLWSETYGADPEILGRSLWVDGRPTSVIGVMPEGFNFPFREDIWTPLQADPSREDWGQNYLLEVFGRLKEDVTLKQARAEMGLIGQRVAEAYPEKNQLSGTVFKADTVFQASILVKPYPQAFTEGPEQGLASASLGAVLFVLLIACANVANLLLARTATRSRELAVRTALGAGRGRIVAQILAESFCLALPAAAVGLLLGGLGVSIFNTAAAGLNAPSWIDVRIDTTSLALVLVLAGVATLMSGLAPALRASRIDAQAVLKSEARGSGLRIGRLSKALVVAEVALSCVLLIGAGLLVRSILTMTWIDFDFRTERVFTAQMGLLDATYPDEASRLRFWRQLRGELETVPGIQKAALTSLIPVASASGRQSYAHLEKAHADRKSWPWARFAVVSPGFFDTLDVKLLSGRDFSSRDDSSTEAVVIVNRSFAEREWPAASPVGQRLRVGRSDGEDEVATVVGVVPDLYMDGYRNRTRAGLYFPMAQRPEQRMSIVAATSSEATAITSAVRARVSGLDPALPVYAVEAFDELLFTETFFHRLVATIFSIFGGVALLLASVGLYGVMAFSVSRRTAEVGVRMALGAAHRDVMRLVVGQGLRQIGVGVGIGLLLASAVTRVLSHQLVGVGPTDPLTFSVIAVLLVAVGAAASWLPARRATRIDPVAALRRD